MKRRNFFKTAFPVAAAPFLLNGLPVSALDNSGILNRLTSLDENNENVLVLIQLNGGNDGLSTLIPIDQYSRLMEVRANITIPENNILKIKNDLGFHPQMNDMKDLFHSEQLGIVQNVGYPNSNLSHFRSTDIWTSGSAYDEFLSTGWLGRYLEDQHPSYPTGYPNDENPDPLAITIGSVVSQTCQGPASNMGMAISSLDSFQQLLEDSVENAPNTPYGHELTFIRQSIQQTNAYNERLIAASEASGGPADLYDGSKLGSELQIISQLMAGGLKTKIYIANLGGFDTHSDQVDVNDVEAGNHSDLMRTLSNAMAAFQTDLNNRGLQDRVITMTFSEFGRRIRSNESYGTDHGEAAPLFVMGSKVNPSIFGLNPQLPETIENKTNVPMEIDFRSVYGSILMDWFGASENDIASLLFQDFTYIPILGKPTAVDEFHNNNLEISNYPNPIMDKTKIKFHIEQGKVELILFDHNGKLIQQVLSKTLQGGHHEFTFNTTHLTKGHYYLRLVQRQRSQTHTMIKL